MDRLIIWKISLLVLERQTSIIIASLKVARSKVVTKAISSWVAKCSINAGATSNNTAHCEWQSVEQKLSTIIAFTHTHTQTHTYPFTNEFYIHITATQTPLQVLPWLCQSAVCNAQRVPWKMPRPHLLLWNWGGSRQPACGKCSTSLCILAVVADGGTEVTQR